MKNYVRPVIMVADQFAEGVYMLSGDAEPVALGEALSAATGEGGKPENAEAADMMSGVENSVGAAEPQTDAEAADSDTGSDSTDAAEVADSAAAPDTQADQDTDLADAGVEEYGEAAASSPITCDSQYMNGVWQAPSEGSWGDVVPGCKEALGCQGCDANKIDGCGLQDVDAASRYINSVGALKPEWEASGKLPTDSPYGI